MLGTNSLTELKLLNYPNLIKQVETSHVSPLGLQQLVSDVIQLLLCVFASLQFFFISTLHCVLLLCHSLRLRRTLATSWLRLVPLLRNLEGSVIF